MRVSLAGTAGAWIGALLVAAPARAAAPVSLQVGGDIKTFTILGVPYDTMVAPAGPFGTGAATARLKVDVHALDRLHLEFQPLLAAEVRSDQVGMMGFSPTLAPPEEAVDLSWQALEGERADLELRVDRLSLAFSAPHLQVRAGRQPITLGRAVIFTPLDLLDPFFPTVLDQEYKPGIDALRVDLYAGTAGRVTTAIAWAGGEDPYGWTGLSWAQLPLGGWDTGLLLAWNRGDLVTGLGTSGAAGPVALWFEGTFTLPTDPGEDLLPYGRVVAGAELRPTPRSALTAEAYVQTLGADAPDGYLALATDPRFARGELWLMGRAYLGVAGTWEVSPLVHASLATIANLEDPSALLVPGLSWSVANRADLAAGLLVGLGARPDPWSGGDFNDTVNSEFGLVPTTGYLELAARF